MEYKQTQPSECPVKCKEKKKRKTREKTAMILPTFHMQQASLTPTHPYMYVCIYVQYNYGGLGLAEIQTDRPTDSQHDGWMTMNSHDSLTGLNLTRYLGTTYLTTQELTLSYTT